MRSTVFIVSNYGMGGEKKERHTLIHGSFKELMGVINFLLPAGFSVEKIKTPGDDPTSLDEISYDYLNQDDNITVTCEMGIKTHVDFLTTNTASNGRGLFGRDVIHGSYQDLYNKIERECSPRTIQKIQIILTDTNGSMRSVDLNRTTYGRVNKLSGLIVICTEPEVLRITNGGRIGSRLAEALLSLERRIGRLERREK